MVKKKRDYAPPGRGEDLQTNEGKKDRIIGESSRVTEKQTMKRTVKSSDETYNHTEGVSIQTQREIGQRKL